MCQSKYHIYYNPNKNKKNYRNIFLNSKLTKNSKKNNKKHNLTIFKEHLPLLIKFEIARHFPKLLPYLNIKPITASFLITENCCFRCVMCGIWKSQPKDELSTDEVKNILLQLKEEGFKKIQFTGGEPLLRSDILEIIDYTNRIGFQTIRLATNGYLLNKRNILKLINSGVSSFSISLDAIGEDFDKIRGTNGAYEKVINALNILSKLKKTNNIDVNISTMIMHQNLDNIFEVIEIGEKLKIPVTFNLLDFNLYFFKSVSNKEKLKIEPQDLQKLDIVVDKLVEIKKEKPWLIGRPYVALLYIKNYFRYPLQKSIPCSMWLTKIVIDSEGNVLPCLALKPIGNLRNEKLKIILNSHEYAKIRKKMFVKDCPGCSCGYTSNLQHHLPSIIKEIWLKYRFHN